MKALSNWLLGIFKTPFVHGLFMVVGGGIVTAISTSIQSGHFPNSWADIRVILIGGFGLGIAYIAKNMSLGSSTEKNDAPQVPKV